MSMRKCLIDSIEAVRSNEDITETTRQEVVEALEKIANDQRLTDESKLARSIQVAKEYRKDLFIAQVSKRMDEAFQESLLEGAMKLPLEERISAFRRALESFYSIRGDNSQSSTSVSVLMEGERRRAAGKLHEVWEAVYPRSKALVTNRDSETSAQVHKELLGIDSGSNRAKELAGQVQEVLEEYRQKLNDAGVYVEKREDFVPQSHGIAKIQADRPGWFEFMRENLDPTMHPDPDATAERILSTLATRHLNEDTSSTISMQRKVHFKSPEAEFEYFHRFGEGDSFSEELSGTVDAMARKSVLADRLGPTASKNAEEVVARLEKDNAEALNDARSRANAGERGAKAEEKRLKKDARHALWAKWSLESMTGELHNPASQNIAAIGNASRNWAIVQLLGKVPLSIVGQDFWNSVYQTRFHTGGFGSALSRQVKGVVDVIGKDSAREYAKKMGAWSHALQAGAVDRYSSTFQTADEARSLTRKASTAAQRASGVYALDNAIRGASMLNISSNMMDATRFAFSDLNPKYQTVLKNNGFDHAKWEKFRKAAKAFEGTGAVDIEKLPRDLRDLTLGFLYRELDSAVIRPQHFDRAVMSAGQQAGTYAGETTAAITQFWSWPIAFFRNAVMRELSMGGTGAVGFAGGMIAAGMVTTQLYEIAEGNPTFTLESPDLWKRGIARSGLLTPVGELALQSLSERGADIEGPAMDMAFSTINTVGQSSMDYLDGRSDRASRQILQQAQDLAIPNHWWSQYSLTSRAMDAAMWELDPQYMADRERRFVRENRNM